MDNSFKIGDREFKVGKLDAFKQFHVVRRIAPILSDMLPMIKDAMKLKDAAMSEDQQLDALAKFAAPIMEGLSKLSDADAEFVLKGLLASVEVKHMGAWARIVNGDVMMIQDLDLPTMIQAAGRSFMFNLSGFFAALPRQS